MQSRLFAVFASVLLIYGCSDQKTQTSLETKKEPVKKQTFFPVTDYIRGQLKEIESLPVTPVKIINNNGNRDSIWMKKENIRAFAEPFLHPEIDSANFNELFIESSFLDQTIDAITLSYDPAGKLPDSLQLRRWDVYINPKKNTIIRIYMVKEGSKNGITQTFQLLWKSGQWCKITTITEHPGNPPDIKEELMKWDFSE